MFPKKAVKEISRNLLLICNNAYYYFFSVKYCNGGKIIKNII